VGCNSGSCTVGIEVAHVSFHDSHYRHFDRRRVPGLPLPIGMGTPDPDSRTRESTNLPLRHCCSHEPGAPGLAFETWESIDIDEIAPYSSGDPLLVFKHF
jgi:hypothetical protein